MWKEVFMKVFRWNNVLYVCVILLGGVFLDVVSLIYRLLRGKIWNFKIEWGW